jgi:hypothetical protein
MMDHVKRLLSSNRLLASAWALSLGFSAIYFALYLGVFRPGYAINDDIKMISVVAGYPIGSPQPFLIFSNVLLGFMLVPLYALATRANWEVLLFVLLQFVSVWAVLQAVLSSSLAARHKAFAVVAVLVCEAYFVLNITFTTTASFACLAGSCLLLSGARSSRDFRLAPTLAGGGLIFVSSFIRFEMVPITLSLALPAVVLARRAFRLQRLVLALLATGLFVCAGYVFNLQYVRASQEWHAYDVYNNTRSLIQDTHRLENLGRTIRRIGWSANDQELFVRWYFPDPQTYSLDKLQFLVDHVPALSSDPVYTMMSVLGAPFSPSLLPYVLVMATACLWIQSQANRYGAVWPVLGLWVACLLVNAYFGSAWKVTDRILLSTFSTTAVLGFLVPLWLIADRPDGVQGKLATSGDRTKFFSAAGLTLIAAVGLTLFQSSTTSLANERKQELYRQVLSDLTKLEREGAISKDALIVSPGHGVPLEWADPWTVQYPSVAYLDMNWLTFAPPYNETLQAFGIQDLPAALYERGNLYLMTRANIVPYIRRAYLEHEGVTVDFRSIYAMPNPEGFVGYTDVHLYQVVQSQ